MALMKVNSAQMELGKIEFLFFRIYAMDDTMIYEGMIFKANHNLFEVTYYFNCFLVSLYLIRRLL